MCINPKYKIRKFLLSLPGQNNSNKYALCIFLGISEKTLDRWATTEKQSEFSITSDLLYKMAEFFKCTPNELINQ